MGGWYSRLAGSSERSHVVARRTSEADDLTVRFEVGGLVGRGEARQAEPDTDVEAELIKLGWETATRYNDVQQLRFQTVVSLDSMTWTMFVIFSWCQNLILYLSCVKVSRIEIFHNQRQEHKPIRI